MPKSVKTKTLENALRNIYENNDGNHSNKQIFTYSLGCGTKCHQTLAWSYLQNGGQVHALSSYERVPLENAPLGLAAGG